MRARLCSNRFGRRLYVSNIDLPFRENVYDAPHTISVIELPE